jgi:hypothetical protein
MDLAKENRGSTTFSATLAGLEAGMLGVCWMLAWLGISAKWQLRSFWTAENLMASIFYGDDAIRSGFAGKTVSGLAAYLLLYSLLGAGFAAIVADRLPRMRVVLLSMVFSLGWYFLSFRLLGRTIMPLVALLHSSQPTAFGHILYGAILGRYPRYLPGAQPAADAETPMPDTATETPETPPAE